MSSIKKFFVKMFTGKQKRREEKKNKYEAMKKKEMMRTVNGDGGQRYDKIDGDGDSVSLGLSLVSELTLLISGSGSGEENDARPIIPKVQKIVNSSANDCSDHVDNDPSNSEGAVGGVGTSNTVNNDVGPNVELCYKEKIKETDIERNANDLIKMKSTKMCDLWPTSNLTDAHMKQQKKQRKETKRLAKLKQQNGSEMISMDVGPLTARYMTADEFLRNRMETQQSTDVPTPTKLEIFKTSLPEPRPKRPTTLDLPMLAILPRPPTPTLTEPRPKRPTTLNLPILAPLPRPPMPMTITPPSIDYPDFSNMTEEEVEKFITETIEKLMKLNNVPIQVPMIKEKNKMEEKEKEREITIAEKTFSQFIWDNGFSKCNII